MADSPQTYPDLRSVEQYRKLLRNLHTLNATESHATLVRMLEGLLASPLGPEEQLEVLESPARRSPSSSTRCRRRYAAHPLPPTARKTPPCARWCACGRPSAPPTPASPKAAAAATSSAPSGRCSPSAASSISARSSSNISAPTGPNPRGLEGRPRRLPRGRTGRHHPQPGDRPLNNTWKAQSPDEACIRCCWWTSPTPTAATSVSSTDLPLGPALRPPTASCRPAGRRTTPVPYGLDLTEDHGLRPIALIGARPGMCRFDGHRLAARSRPCSPSSSRAPRRPRWAWATTAPSPPARACWCRSTARGACRPPAGASPPQQEGRQQDLHPLGRHLPAGLGQGIPHRPTVARPWAAATTSIRHHLRRPVDDEVPDVINPEAEVLRRGFGLDDWQTVDHSVSGFRIQRKHPASASSTTSWWASSRATAASICWVR